MWKRRFEVSLDGVSLWKILDPFTQKFHYKILFKHLIEISKNQFDNLLKIKLIAMQPFSNFNLKIPSLSFSILLRNSNHKNFHTIFCYSFWIKHLKCAFNLLFIKSIFLLWWTNIWIWFKIVFRMFFKISKYFCQY